MTRYTNPLDHVGVAAPCPAEWERMVGNEQVRFCAECQLNVYNLSGMTRIDAERLIYRTEGRLCIRYYRKADGTILTRNCPVGLQAIKQRLSKTVNAVAALVLSFFAGLCTFLGWQKTAPVPERGYTQGTIAVRPEVRQGAIRHEPQPEAVMGARAIPSELQETRGRIKQPRHR